MIGTIRKHSTWLWAIIIVLTVITFVWWGTPQRDNSGGRVAGNYGSINGERISRDEFADAQRDFYLQYFFRSGDWPDGRNRFSDVQIQQETYIRLLLLRKLRDFQIHVSDEQVAKEAVNFLRTFAQGRAVSLDAFVAQLLQPKGFTADDFGRFIRHEIGIEQLVAAVGAGGKLVTPEEARSIYEREHRELSAQAVFFNQSNFLAEVKVTPEALSAFYTNHLAEYRLPERVQVDYVRFSASNYVAAVEEEFNQASNLTDLVEQKYEQLGGTNYFRDAKSPEEAKELIRSEIIKSSALAQARKSANEFGQELYKISPMSATNLAKLAAERGLSVRLSEPFDRNFPPDDLKVRSEFARQAFMLSSEEPFAGPLVGEDAVYVIALAKRLPSEIPQLNEIHDRVVRDFKFTQAQTLAHQAGSKFAALLAAGLPNGKAFSAIATEAGVHPVQIPPFSISSRSVPEIEAHVSLEDFKNVAFRTAVGKASESVPTDQGAFIVYVQALLPLDAAKVEAELPRFIPALRRSRQAEAFNAWFSKEIQRELRDIPSLREAMGG